MEELKFVSLKTQNQKVRAPRITWRRIKNGVIQSLAISFAAIVAATLLMSLCVLLSTCAEGKPDPAEFVGPIGPAKPKPAFDAGQGGSSSGGFGGKGGEPSSGGSSGTWVTAGTGGSAGSSEIVASGGSFATAGTGGSLYGVGGSSSLGCDLVGQETCTGLDEDCDGLIDCQDPDCAKMGVCQALDAGNCNGETAIHLYYQGPAWVGTNSLYAWWMPPGLPPRTWGVVDECLDLLANDGQLDCIFHVPHCTTSFEFQVFLPYSRYWGDISCSVNGGCGSTIGNVALVIQGTPLQYYFKSNGIKDPNCNGNGCDPYPYKNGLVDFVP